MACLLFVGSIVSAEAATLHRWPIDYYASPHVSRWFDHDPTANVVRKYDGVITSTNSFDDNHNGTDILGNRSPTYIRAGAGGTLYYAIVDCPNYPQSSCGNGYGNHVKIQHPDGKVTIYAHMSPGGPGQSGWNSCGQVVGIMGNSGASTGNHLHLEMWSGTYPSQRIDYFGGSWSNGGFSYWVSQNGGGAGKPGTWCQ